MHCFYASVGQPAFSINFKMRPVSDTLVKLMEYGEEDDDLEENYEESLGGSSSAVATRKPFWAL